MPYRNIQDQKMYGLTKEGPSYARYVACMLCVTFGPLFSGPAFLNDPKISMLSIYIT